MALERVLAADPAATISPGLLLISDQMTGSRVHTMAFVVL